MNLILTMVNDLMSKSPASHETNEIIVNYEPNLIE